MGRGQALKSSQHWGTWAYSVVMPAVICNFQSIAWWMLLPAVVVALVSLRHLIVPCCCSQVDKQLNVLEFNEKPPRKLLATMSIDTLEYGFGGWGLCRVVWFVQTLYTQARSCLYICG